MLKVVDLNAGLGGRVVAFKNAGFSIERVCDLDKENCNYLSKLIDSSKVEHVDLDKLDLSGVGEIDVICAKYIQRAFVFLDKNGNSLPDKSSNESVYRIVKEHAPRYLVIEVPISELSHNAPRIENYITKFRLLGYVFKNCSLDEAICSGFPIKGRQAFFYGVLGNIGIELKDVEIAIGIAKSIKIEDSNLIDLWYRKISVANGDWENGKFYLRKLFTDAVEKSEVINMGGKRENYYVDEKGVRRFTHNELAYLKGLEYTNFDNCINKQRMYNKIAYASNAYAVAKIVDCILDAERNKKAKSLNKKAEQDNSKVVFPKLRLTSINIEHLKGLHGVRLDFHKNLVALMGVNGAGKTTILHAIACTYSKFEKGENYKFSYFFTPNTDMLWKGSSISVTNYNEVTGEENTKNYRKDGARWARYNSRPMRDIYYLGIETCLPDIEKEKGTSFIRYNSISDDSKESRQVIEAASCILQKDYKQLIDNETSRKKYLGVSTRDGLKYSSLSMGAGEQRVLRLLHIIFEANQYSLILIDELDVLLHLDALKKLIKYLSEVAVKRHLQIIFTTHCIEMQNLTEYVEIKYLDHSAGNVYVYESIKPDFLYELSGEVPKEYTIYVEDNLAKMVVKRVLKDLGMLSRVSIILYGAIENAAIVASVKVIDGIDFDKCLIVMDGDKHVSADEKRKLIEKRWTGTENDREEKIDKALSLIKQFNLPDSTAPERYIHEMLIKSEIDNEYVRFARSIVAVDDSHDWLGRIVTQFGDETETYMGIMETVSQSSEWNEYVSQIENWIKSKKNQ